MNSPTIMKQSAPRMRGSRGEIEAVHRAVLVSPAHAGVHTDLRLTLSWSGIR